MASKYLDSFVDYEKTGFDGIRRKFDLAGLRRVLKDLGDPQRDYLSVHVAGTKGKGSICAFTSSILRDAGYRVGLYTSPHFFTPAERIRVNGRMIGGSDLVRTVSVLKERIGRDAAKRFTFFEVYTLLAILYFSMKKVDYAVFETGMGGRLDATNVIDARICAISPVSYDHMNVLGSRIGQIAREKAAIIHRGAHCVSAPQRAAALDAIISRCGRVGASLSVVGKDVTYSIKTADEKGSAFDVQGNRGSYRGCRTRMPGRFQVTNCAAAVAVCERVLHDKRIDKRVIKRGIRNAFIPGRLEVLARRPLIVIDGAQNGDSAEKLKYSVEEIFKYDRLILLLGVSGDKDIGSICRRLAPMADEVVLTRASTSRAADPNLIKGYIRGRRVRITGDVKEALGTAFSIAGRDDMILATGSFFVIAEVTEIIRGRPARYHPAI
ncbi:MAG: folylpolyglutamate synthase/dihydrofolate synthase family protein [Candidatus Omnitrophota bacterium]|nr:folylpolyglutamate synthase/dihydrofolate synthase family protein [Candidatus Omnitrophota bacterium]